MLNFIIRNRSDKNKIMLLPLCSILRIGHDDLWKTMSLERAVKLWSGTDSELKHSAS